MSYNEMFDGDKVREPYARLRDWVQTMPEEFRQMKQAEAEALFRRIGITFAVYGEGGDPGPADPVRHDSRASSNRPNGGAWNVASSSAPGR